MFESAYFIWIEKLQKSKGKHYRRRLFCLTFRPKYFSTIAIKFAERLHQLPSFRTCVQSLQIFVHFPDPTDSDHITDLRTLQCSQWRVSQYYTVITQSTRQLAALTTVRDTSAASRLAGSNDDLSLTFDRRVMTKSLQ